MGARFYDPSVGRFITEDSYLGSNEDPKSRDRYAYAEDDPEKNRDPSGHIIVSTSADDSKYGLLTTDTSSTVVAVVVVIAGPGPMSGHGANTGSAAKDDPYAGVILGLVSGHGATVGDAAKDTTTTVTITTTITTTTLGVSSVTNSPSVDGGLWTMTAGIAQELFGVAEVIGGVLGVIYTAGMILPVDVFAAGAIADGIRNFGEGAVTEFQGAYEIGQAVAPSFWSWWNG